MYQINWPEKIKAYRPSTYAFSQLLISRYIFVSDYNSIIVQCIHQMTLSYSSTLVLYHNSLLVSMLRITEWAVENLLIKEMNFEKKVNYVRILLIKNDGVSCTRSPNKWMNFGRKKKPWKFYKNSFNFNTF
jgi:hypothetical protein